MAIHIERRQFIFALGGAAVAWPLAARAQQSANASVGSSTRLPHPSCDRVPPRLAEAGYPDGRDVTLKFRWAEGQCGR
jgi:putative tryptophan/tyrosine transport system substrate-binding protein